MYKTTNMIMKNPIYLLSKNNATAVFINIKFFCKFPPAGTSLQLVPNLKFRIQNSLPVPQSPVRLALPALSAFSYFSYLPSASHLYRVNS